MSDNPDPLGQESPSKRAILKAISDLQTTEAETDAELEVANEEREAAFRSLATAQGMSMIATRWYNFSFNNLQRYYEDIDSPDCTARERADAEAVLPFATRVFEEAERSVEDARLAVERAGEAAKRTQQVLEYTEGKAVEAKEALSRAADIIERARQAGA